jgi:hypothetical protein
MGVVKQEIFPACIIKSRKQWVLDVQTVWDMFPTVGKLQGGDSFSIQSAKLIIILKNSKANYSEDMLVVYYILKIKRFK